MNLTMFSDRPGAARSDGPRLLYSADHRGRQRDERIVLWQGLGSFYRPREVLSRTVSPSKTLLTTASGNPSPFRSTRLQEPVNSLPITNNRVGRNVPSPRPSSTQSPSNATDRTTSSSPSPFTSATLSEPDLEKIVCGGLNVPSPLPSRTLVPLTTKSGTPSRLKSPVAKMPASAIVRGA